VTVATDRDGYIHGTDADEQSRLARLNDLLNQSSLSRLAVRPGERVLDVGAGMGQMARAMARAAGPNGRVVAVERSAEQIATGNRLAADQRLEVDTRQGDANALPLLDDEWGTFDVAHARFLLEHVANPGAVVAAMARAVRSGGRVVLEDDDHELLRLYPSVPAFEKLWRAYMASYARIGRDPEIGRRLPALLAEAGLTPVRSDWPFFGACAGSDTFDLIVTNCRHIITGAREAIEAEGISAAAFEDGLARYDAWAREPGAAYWYCTFWACGVKG
jgi:SAM-dependent methyltransferase